MNSAIQVIQKYNPEFQKEIDISDILSTVDSETALLTFCITEKGSIGFVVSGSNNIQSVDMPGFKTKDLDNLLFLHQEHGSITGGLVDDYLSYFHSLGTDQENALKSSWQNSLNDVLSFIGSRLLCPLIAKFPPQIRKLIFIPSDGLFILPLHAVPLSDGQLLCDHYCISYAPSIKLLKEMQTNARKIEERALCSCQS